ncbi:T9SS type A sorting domain-containing protein [Flavobacterium sp. 3HN19-14]|uniref:T9SS type A sorting domain-containing protein n=1 Tax=Flavobacterium sp. 3HN19-14 TaxID=3448133 RepID=UPI003EE0CAD9
MFPTQLNTPNLKVKNVVGPETYISQNHEPYPSGYNSPYFILASLGTNVVSLPEIPDYFTITPNPAEVTLVNTCDNDFMDFCIVPNTAVNDLEILLIPYGDSRPGFVSGYSLVIFNNGSTTQTGIATLSFDNSAMTFVSSNPAPANATSNNLQFNFTNLEPFQSKIFRNVNFQLYTNPVVNSGDVVTFTASIPVDADATPSDNTAVLSQTVVNSLDPNDITVHEGATITEEQADDYLHYTIRFQNTGTASAVNVRIFDELDSKLDWNSMEIISSSHNCRLKQKDNNAEFLFENIYLPQSDADEPSSHGYITYKIKPSATVALGDIIANAAGIYFDFNDPIVTNTVTTALVAPLKTPEFIYRNINVAPNPVAGMLTVSGVEAIDSISVTSLLGQELKTVKGNKLQEKVDFSNFAKGTYIVKVKSAGIEKTFKIVKN